jgi:hypothetical protein
LSECIHRIELGKTYVNKRSSQDPNLDLNKNLLKFKFEVRDAETRSTVYEITSIKELLISQNLKILESFSYF